MNGFVARVRRRRLARRVANGTASFADRVAHAFLYCGVWKLK